MTLKEKDLEPGKRILWAGKDYTLVKKISDKWYVMETLDPNAQFKLKTEEDILKHGELPPEKPDNEDKVLKFIREWIPKTTLIKRRSDINNIELYEVKMSFHPNILNKAVRTTMSIRDDERKPELVTYIYDEVKHQMKEWLLMVTLQLCQYFFGDEHFKSVEELTNFFRMRHDEWTEYKHKLIQEGKFYAINKRMKKIFQTVIGYKTSVKSHDLGEMLDKMTFFKVKDFFECNLKKSEHEYFIGYEIMGNALYIFVREEFRDYIGRGEYSLKIIQYPTDLYDHNKNSVDERFIVIFSFPETIIKCDSIFTKICKEHRIQNTTTSNNLYELLQKELSATPQPHPARKTLGVREVITIVGSTKFRKEIKRWAWDRTMEGKLVLFDPFAKEDYPELPKYRSELEMQHEQKIMMADIVFVFNKGGYIGEHTREEIVFAEQLNKQILYLEEKKDD